MAEKNKEKAKKPPTWRRTSESMPMGDWGEEQPLDVSAWEIDSTLLDESGPLTDPFLKAERVWRGDDTW